MDYSNYDGKITFINEEDRQKFVESMNFLIKLLNRLRVCTLGYETTITCKDGRVYPVPIEFTAFIPKEAYK